MDVLPSLSSPGARVAVLLGAAGFGAIWGSFLNVCIARIPIGMSVARPPSHCFSCGTKVLARDNIPILSYFLLRGRCRHCGARFSPRHALVEALAAVLSALIVWHFVLEAPGLPLGLRVARYAAYFAFAAVLVVLTFIDLDTKRLPDTITLPAVAVFYLAGFAVGGPSWWERAIGAAGGYLAVRIVADVYYYSTGREGLGLGDGKLLAFTGALLGWKALPHIVFLASFVGIMVSVPVLLARRRRGLQAASAATVEPGTVAGTTQPCDGPVLPPADGAPAAPGPAGAPAAEPAVPAPLSIRKAEVPFGPFLAASALAYLFLHEPAAAVVARMLTGG